MLDNWNPDVTVAAIIEENGKFLLVEERIRGQLLLNQPAGHLDPDEDLFNAVSRETREESAWQFTPEAIVGMYQFNPHPQVTYLRVCFCGKHHSHDPQQPLDHPIERAVWMGYEEIKALPDEKLRSPMVLRCIEDYLSGKRYPLELLQSI